jgi:hypothetical protein
MKRIKQPAVSDDTNVTEFPDPKLHAMVREIEASVEVIRAAALTGNPSRALKTGHAPTETNRGNAQIRNAAWSRAG